jgi:hypothetical protein
MQYFSGVRRKTRMSFPALRQAAFGARRLYTVGAAAEGKGTEKGGSETQADRSRLEGARTQVALEPHWQAAIDSATD